MPIIDFNTDFNVQEINIEPYILTDVVSSTEIYVGTSKSFSNQDAPNWRIKHIKQTGNVWSTAYPNGDQHFIFVWSDRGTYTYK